MDRAALLARFERHLRLERGLSAHTVRAYRADLESLLDFTFGDTAEWDPADFTLSALRGWLADGADAGQSRATLARHAAAARTFSGWASRTGLLADDVAQRLGAPRPAPHVLEPHAEHSTSGPWSRDRSGGPPDAELVERL